MPTLNVPKSACSLLHAGFHPNDVSDEIRLFIRGAIQGLICQAIDDGIPPAELPAAAETGIPMNISFTKGHDRAIRNLSKEKKIREGDAALSYLYAAIARGDAIERRKSVSESPLHPYVAALGLTDRQHQNVFGEALIETLSGKSIGMVEGATGIGKTLGMVAAAAHVLEGRSFGRSLIAVPTLTLLRQFARQHQALADAIPEFPSARFILGKNEFVSVGELRILLDSGTFSEYSSTILGWLGQNGPSPSSDQAIDHRFLISSLIAIAPQFPVDAVRCGNLTDDGDPGMASYRAQFEVDESERLECEIIYCTHAMLAADIRRRMFGARSSEEGLEIRQRHRTIRQEAMGLRAALDDAGNEAYRDAGMDIKNSIDGELFELAAQAVALDAGILPSWQYLLIDEAHLFESNLANTFAFNLSLGRLLQHINAAQAEGAVSAAAAKRASKAMTIIRHAGENNDDINLKSTSPQARDVCAALNELLSIVTGVKPSKTSPTITTLKGQASVIRTALRLATTSVLGRSMLCYSPIRAFPQLSVGRASVSSELAFLWHSCEAGACVSATLYLRRLDKDSASYMAGILNIPTNRMREYPVIRPHWVTAPVAGLWIPESTKNPSGRLWLRPPTRSDKLDTEQYRLREEEWLEDLSAEIRKIQVSAAGGTLVLMTSYTSAKGLAERLADIDGLVVAEQGVSISRQVEGFVNQHSAGKKPLWIAVGGAWTGVDINGKDYGLATPGEDNLLTDLVIPRFPFGTNMSMTHRHRAEQASNVPWDLLDAAMRFKQGLGRLVRREGLPPNRRIFVLDGRMNEPTFDFFMSHLRRIIGIYPVKTLKRSAAIDD